MVDNANEARLRIYTTDPSNRLDDRQSSEEPAIASQSGSPEIVYQSQVMHEAVAQAKQFAHSNATVLLNGESGTGKELFASLIHRHSSRSENVFVRVNCASLSESLIESELFGHEKGAFTGASESRTGRFEFANGGTLLLDEISEVPVSIQAKLLRVLEENEIQRVGSNTTKRVDVRIIATSNRDLQQEVAADRFRADLFHRLNVLQIAVPPLRDRVEDIPLLAKRFVEIYRDESRVPIDGLATDAIEKLMRRDWTGNVRELRNTIHRACVLASSNNITATDIPNADKSSIQVPEWMLELSLEDVQRHMILASLEQHQWNKTRTAEKLGVTARTLSNKLNAYQAQGLNLKAG